MPLDEKILGFSNMWYRPAMDHAEERELEKGLKIRLVALRSSKRLPAGARMISTRVETLKI
jgi:hypothetical protein